MGLQRDVQAQRQMGLDDKQVRLRMRSMYEQMRNIDELFAEVGPQKDLTRKWDAQMERGEAPDLDGHLKSLKVSDALKAHLDRLAKKA